MESTPFLIVGVGLLILVNGLFSCLEIALVSAPRARLKRFEQEKRPGARTAIALQKDIDGFFAAVQIGVTFIGTLSSAIGGASALSLLAPALEYFNIPLESTAAHVISILVVSLTIAYVSLIIGELVPKSLARRYPGRISLVLSRPFAALFAVLRPAVWVLTRSTRAVLRLIGIRASDKSPVITAEELRFVASELVESRQITTGIYDLLVQTTRLSKIRVEDIMIPRHRITLIRAESKNDPTLRDKAVKTFRKHHFSYYPVVDRKGENVLGILNVKDLLLLDSRGSISPLLRKPNFTARGQSLDKALSVMQKLDEQLSVVVDEHGNIDGVITLEDILQELIGEMSEERTLPQDPVAPTQAFAVDGVTTLHELKEAHGVSLPQSLYYSTLAGFIFDRMGKIPVTGDTIDFETWRFEISQMAVNRIKEVRIIPLKPSTSVDIS